MLSLVIPVGLMRVVRYWPARLCRRAPHRHVRHLISHVVSNEDEEDWPEPHISAILPLAGTNEVPEPSIAPALLENCYSDHPFPNVTHPSHNSRLGTCWPAGSRGRSRRCATRADILRWSNTHIAGQPKTTQVVMARTRTLTPVHTRTQTKAKLPAAARRTPKSRKAIAGRDPKMSRRETTRKRVRRARLARNHPEKLKAAS